MQKPEKQDLMAKVDRMRHDISELALRNSGTLNKDMIFEALDADADIVKVILKKMRAKIRGDRVYFPDIEKSLKKRKTWRDIWPFRK